MRGAEVVLMDEQRASLKGWLGAGKTERRMAFRAEVILAVAEGLSNKAVAERLGPRPAVVSKRRGPWLARRMCCRGGSHGLRRARTGSERRRGGARPECD